MQYIVRTWSISSLYTTQYTALRHKCSKYIRSILRSIFAVYHVVYSGGYSAVYDVILHIYYTTYTPLYTTQYTANILHNILRIYFEHMWRPTDLPRAAYILHNILFWISSVGRRTPTPSGARSRWPPGTACTS